MWIVIGIEIEKYIAIDGENENIIWINIMSKTLPAILIIATVSMRTD